MIRTTGAFGRCVCLLALLFSGFFLNLTQAAHETGPSGGFAALSVQDLGRSLDFYVQHLGFELISESSNAERRGALLRTDGLLLELAQFTDAVSGKDFDPERPAHLWLGLFKLGLVVHDLDQRFATLQAASDTAQGAHGPLLFFPIVEASNGLRSFAIKDPDGNIIQFFGP